MTQRTLEQDLIWRRILQAYHDAIVHVPGQDRFAPDGTRIRPMGLKLAAAIAGINQHDLSNRLNPNMPEHRATLEGFVLHLQSGMDLAPLNELERVLGRVAIPIPGQIDDHEDIQLALAASIREFGDIGRSIADALDQSSDGGRRITQRELLGIHREFDEAVGQIYALLHTVEAEAEK